MAFLVETERLRIRAWTPADSDGLRALAGDPAVMRFISDGVPWSDDEVRAFLARQAGHLARHDFCLGAVVAREAPAAAGNPAQPVVGLAGLQPLGTTRDVEVGWWLTPGLWGRGLATEAARALVRFAFERAGLARVVAIARPENRASLRVMQKLGMVFEGVVPGHEFGLRVPDVEVALHALDADLYADAVLPPGFALRDARDDDAEGLIALVGSCFAEYPGCVLDVDGEEPELRAIATAFRGRGGRFWVVEHGGRVVGSVGCAPGAGPGAVELKKLYVARAHRRRGLGSALCRIVEREARACGAARVALWSDTRFHDAHRLYRSRGFEGGRETRALHDRSQTIESLFSKELPAVRSGVRGA